MSKKYVYGTKYGNKNSAKSYESWLSGEGNPSRDGYYNELAESKKARQFKDTSYGVSAESLATDGLLKSGYADYLKSVTEKDKGLADKKARSGYLSASAKNKSGYLKYIDDYNKAQAELTDTLIEKLANELIFDEAEAFRLAIGHGISEKSATESVPFYINSAKDKAVKRAIEYATSKNMSASGAKNYALSIGLDDRAATKVMKAIEKNYAFDKEEISNMSADEYLEHLKEQNKNEKY